MVGQRQVSASRLWRDLTVPGVGTRAPSFEGCAKGHRSLIPLGRLISKCVETKIPCYPRSLGLLPNAQLLAVVCGHDSLLVCEAWHTLNVSGSMESVEDGALTSRWQILDRDVKTVKRLSAVGSPWTSETVARMLEKVSSLRWADRERSRVPDLKRHSNRLISK